MTADPLAFLLSAAALGQAILCVVLLITRTGQDRHRRWLALSFMGLGVLALGPVSAALFAPLYPLAMGLVLVALYALPVLFWLYTREVTNLPDADPVAVSWKHMIAPVSGLAGLAAILSLPAETREAMLFSGTLDESSHAEAVALLIFVLVIGWTPVSTGYALAIQRRLIRHRRLLRENVSNTDGRDLIWLSGIILVIAIIWGSAVILLLLDNLVADLAPPASLGPLMLLTLIMALSLRGLDQGYAFTPPPGRNLSASAAEETETFRKYRKSALSDDDAKRIAQRLEDAMQQDRLYLDPNLSLTKLARHVRVASNHVSQTLNEALEETFFDYVNRWRIEAALPHIAEGKETVLTIALDVGFNTRSTFYTAFKRVTGMTPRAYRETAKKTAG